jgi:hypothetical protein
VCAEDPDPVPVIYLKADPYMDPDPGFAITMAVTFSAFFFLFYHILFSLSYNA